MSGRCCPTLPSGLLSVLPELEFPCFVYDLSPLSKRLASAADLVDRLYYPIKSNPHPAILSEVAQLGYGFDICSRGDLELALATGCSASSLSYTGVILHDDVLQMLVAAGAHVNIDSLDQATLWERSGGNHCGVRLASAVPESPYGAKFGLSNSDFARLLGTDFSARITALHAHEGHASRSPLNMVQRLIDILSPVPDPLWPQIEQVNIGGGWPEGPPRSWATGIMEPLLGEMAKALVKLREHLRGKGFVGTLSGEPGEWVVGPTGYWLATVTSVKESPIDQQRRIVVVDTNTPVPCRPSRAPFVVLGQTRLDPIVTPAIGLVDIYGSANTGLDVMGRDVPLPEVRPGDILVSCGQGAYSRSLVSSFNERPTPRAYARPL